MALNFPNPALQTPLNEFSPDSTPAKSTNGVTYIWTNNEKWVASYVVFNDIYVNVTGDNMTGDLTLGTDKITLNATDGNATFGAGTCEVSTGGAVTGTRFKTTDDARNGAAIGWMVHTGRGMEITRNLLNNSGEPGQSLIRGYATGDSTPAFELKTNGDVKMASQNGGQLAGFRNQLINGDFRVWQRGTPAASPSNMNGGWAADRWQVRPVNSTGGTAGIEKVLDAGKTKMRYTITGATANSYFLHKIEAQNIQCLAGRTITASCYTNGWTPAFNIRVYDSSGTQSANLTGVRTQEGDRWSFTFDLPDQTFGASPESVGLAFNLYLDDGAIPNGTYDIWEFQLEPGPVATPFEHRPIGTELALCQRYFLPLNNSNLRFPVVQSADSANLIFIVPTPVTMRTTPTVTGTCSKIGVATGSVYGSGTCSATVSTFTDTGFVRINGGGFIATDLPVTGRVSGDLDAEL